MKKLTSALLTGIFILSASFNASAESVTLTDEQLMHYQKITFVMNDRSQYDLALLDQKDRDNQNLVIYKGSYIEVLFMPAEKIGSDQYYFLAEKSSGKLVTVRNASSANYEPIVIVAYMGDGSQKFLLEKYYSGIRLVSKSSKKALTIEYQNRSDNNRVVQYELNGSNPVILTNMGPIMGLATSPTVELNEAPPFGTRTLWKTAGESYAPYFQVKRSGAADTDSYRVINKPYYRLKQH